MSRACCKTICNAERESPLAMARLIDGTIERSSTAQNLPCRRRSTKARVCLVSDLSVRSPLWSNVPMNESSMTWLIMDRLESSSCLRRRSILRRPILDRNVGDTLKVNRVPSKQSHLICNCDGGDTQIHRRDSNLLCTKLGENFSGVRRKRQNLRTCKITQDVLKPPISSYRLLRFDGLFDVLGPTVDLFVKRNDRCIKQRLVRI